MDWQLFLRNCNNNNNNNNKEGKKYVGCNIKLLLALLVALDN